MDLRGLEPLTPCMPCRCATSCATDPGSRANAHPTTLLLYYIRAPGAQIEGLFRRVAGGLLGGVEQRCEVDDRAVLPQPFELVEVPLVLVEDVHDEVAEIE